MKRKLGEDKLELIISYILILGVLASVAIEVVGMVSYGLSYGNFAVSFQPDFNLKGTDFFNYAGNLFAAFLKGSWTPLHFLGLGIVLLMITPYLRVVASVVYFGLAKNQKYLLITLFVLIVLTVSLLVH